MGLGAFQIQPYRDGQNDYRIIQPPLLRLHHLLVTERACALLASLLPRLRR